MLPPYALTVPRIEVQQEMLFRFPKKPGSCHLRLNNITFLPLIFRLVFYLFLRGGLCPVLRPSISCDPVRNPDITKVVQVLTSLRKCITSTG